MANKLRRRTGAMTANQLTATVRESAHQIWLAGLGAFSTAQREGNKVFEALVKEGGAIHALTQKAAGVKLREAAARAAGTRRMLAQVLEDSVARSLKRFGVPTSKEVDALSRRIAALTALVDKITAKAASKPAAAKPAARTRR